jgi:hypothetical protein
MQLFLCAITLHHTGQVNAEISVETSLGKQEAVNALWLMSPLTVVSEQMSMKGRGRRQRAVLPFPPFLSNYGPVPATWDAVGK